jgi:hypothetical protein
MRVSLILSLRLRGYHRLPQSRKVAEEKIGHLKSLLDNETKETNHDGVD